MGKKRKLGGSPNQPKLSQFFPALPRAADESVGHVELAPQPPSSVAGPSVQSCPNPVVGYGQAAKPEPSPSAGDQPEPKPVGRRGARKRKPTEKAAPAAPAVSKYIVSISFHFTFCGTTLCRIVDTL